MCDSDMRDRKKKACQKLKIRKLARFLLHNNLSTCAYIINHLIIHNFMPYSTIVQRDETGLNMIFEKAKEFDCLNVLEAVISLKFNLRKVKQVLYLVREYQNRLNIESSELVAFSENFIEQYATDHNECFEIALKLMKKIGTTVTGSMKIFRKFCPVVRRQYDGMTVIPVLDYTRLSKRLYASDFFGSEPYEETVKTLLQEMSAFFHHLVTTMAVCKDMIRKEQEVRGDFEQLKRIYEKSCDELLRSVNEVVGTFGAVQLVSKEELEERRKNARPLKEWLANDYHRHDKKWLRREAYIHRLISGGEDGLDGPSSNFWPHDHEWGKKVLSMIDQLHTLGLSTRKTKTEGKVAQYDSLEMVYLLKWSGVSQADENGKVINENKERHFYFYKKHRLKDSEYEFPSWQAVCNSRAFCYKEKMTHQQMADAFAAHLPKQDEQTAKVTVLPYALKKTADVF